MTRLLPDRPALSRFRRSLGALPHGLPTALTFSVSVAVLLIGSSLIVGAGLTATASTPRGEHAIAMAEGRPIGRPSVLLFDQAPRPATGSTARPVPTTASDKTAIITEVREIAPKVGASGLEGLDEGQVAETQRPAEPPPVADGGETVATDSVERGGSDLPGDDRAGRDRLADSGGGWSGDISEPAPTRHPEHTRRWSTPVAEPDHTVSGPTPEPDHTVSGPTNEPEPEDQPEDH